MPRRQEPDVDLSGLVDTLSEGEGRPEYEFWKGPDLLEDIRSGNLPLGRILSPHEAEELRALLSGLIGLFITRHLGDEHSRWQLNVVHKFIFPQKFEVPWSVIEGLAAKYESGHLVRGWALRRLMYELADLLQLDDPHAEDPASSRVHVSPRADQKHRLYPHVLRYCKRNTTLQSLAIRVYLDLIGEQNEEGKIDERSLRRDLRRLRAWEDRDPAHTRLKKEYAAAADQFHWKACIPVRLYSESFVPKTPADMIESELLASLREGEEPDEK